MPTVSWMDVEISHSKDVVIVDCGYVTDQDARKRADAIFALGVSKNQNLIWGPTTGEPRIHVHIPQSKVAAVFAGLPISDKKTWYGASHSFLNWAKRGDA